MILLSFFATSAALAAAPAYECPFKDALVATVLGTPKDLRAQINYDIPRKEREIVIFPDRKIPGIVALPAYRYSIAALKQAAPPFTRRAPAGTEVACDAGEDEVGESYY